MKKALRSSKLFLKRNGSTILTCVGGAGVITTSVMAVKATPKALAILEQAKEEKGEELTKFEKVKVAGPVYIPSIAVGAATLICIFGANVLSRRQQASLAGAYALLDQSYKEYKAKTTELYGADAHNHIKEEIAKDKYVEEEVKEPSDDKKLFFDEFSGRYFEATTEDVVKAEYELNRKISLWGGAHVNEFYEMLNISPIEGGDELGWSSGYLMESVWSQWLDFEHKRVVMDDGLECYIISMSMEPMYDYEYY